MGACLSCCCPESGSSSLNSPDQDEVRRKMAEAAERRIREEEQRGLKSGSVGARRIAEAREQAERGERDTRDSDNTLRWQVS